MLETLLETRKLVFTSAWKFTSSTTRNTHETRKLVCPPQASARDILEKRTLVHHHKSMLETLTKQVGLCIHYKSMLEKLQAYALPAQTRNTLETRKPAFITSACIKHFRDRTSLYLHHKHKLEILLKRESLCVHHKRILRYFREAKTCVLTTKRMLGTLTKKSRL